MAKKIFYASLSLLILVLIFLGAYNFAFKSNVNNPVADPVKKAEMQKANEAAITPPGNIESPLNENVMGAVADKENSLYYFSLDDGSLKRATLDGKSKTVLLSNLPGTPGRIVWSPKHDQVLLFLKQPGGAALWYFSDINRKTLVPLKAEISRPIWNNLGDKILYLFTDPKTKNRTLNIANPDGSAWKKLTDLGPKDYFLASVPQSSQVSFWNRPDGNETSSFQTVSTLGENRHTLVSGTFGGDYLWSPNGEYALESGSDKQNGHVLTLSLLNATTGAVKNLSIPTLVSKTAWSADGNTIYYALPGSLPSEAVLPNDYYGKPLFTKDTFWKMDRETGKSTRLVELKEITAGLDSTDFFLSPKEDFLYFTDRVTKRLFRLEL